MRKEILLEYGWFLSSKYKSCFYNSGELWPEKRRWFCPPPPSTCSTRPLVLFRKKFCEQALFHFGQRICLFLHILLLICIPPSSFRKDSNWFVHLFFLACFSMVHVVQFAVDWLKELRPSEAGLNCSAVLLCSVMCGQTALQCKLVAALVLLIPSTPSPTSDCIWEAVGLLIVLFSGLFCL